ncbi:MAG: LysM peptidoglycan-binding domain-containing protein, partial [Oscillospiraceae bacterium]|nr:LysM peptidoglycan-binding domain-containing protein [Oscillospiraceae bacterium]
VYGKRSAVCLTDAYSNRCALTVETGRCTTGGIQSEQTLRETLRETLQTPQPVSEIVQGCAAFCAPRAEDGALTFPVTVCIYYRSADGSLNAVRRSVQARFSAQLPAGETAIPVSVGAGTLTLAPDGTGVEVLLPLELRIFVEETEELSCVTAITCEEGAEPDFSDRPSLVIERAGADRDLWAAARENGSTVQGILDANGLEDAAAVVPGQMLLIPKMA